MEWNAPLKKRSQQCLSQKKRPNQPSGHSMLMVSLKKVALGLVKEVGTKKVKFDSDSQLVMHQVQSSYEYEA